MVGVDAQETKAGQDNLQRNMASLQQTMQGLANLIQGGSSLHPQSANLPIDAMNRAMVVTQNDPDPLPQGPGDNPTTDTPDILWLTVVGKG